MADRWGRLSANRMAAELVLVWGCLWAAAATAQVSPVTPVTPAQPTTSNPQGATGPEVSVQTVIYKESGGSPRRMEVYFPAGRDVVANEKRPGVILFHGGGWSGGNLGQFRDLCQYLASRGLVAATAEYRMLTAAEAKQLPPGETRKRVCITDAKSAIRWFKQQAAEWGVDPQRIIAGGGSAGGHIAVLATSQPGLNDPADPLEVDTQVAAYLLFNPAFALDDSNDSEVDVLRHLQPQLPPALVMFGTEDSWKQGWDQVQEQLIRQGSGPTTEVWLAEGQPHGFFNRDPWKTVTMLAVDRFLVQQGFLSGEPSLAPPATGETLQRVPLERP